MGPEAAVRERELSDAPDSLSSGDEEISLMDLCIVLAERKRTILWIASAFLLLSIAVSLILPKRYTASVTLLPPQQSPSLSSALAAQLGNLGGMSSLTSTGLGLKNPNDVYVGLLKSRTVEDAVIQRFELRQEYHERFLEDARKALEKKVSIDGSSKDTLIRVFVQDGDPNRAADLANGYVQEYRKFSEHLAITEASQRRLFFERQLEATKNELAAAEEALKVTQQKTGVIQLDSQARALIESAASLRAQVAATEVQIQAMRTYATSENAELIQAEQRLAGLRDQLARLGGAGSSGSDEIIVSKGRVSQASLEYVRKLRDVKYFETIFEILARQLEAAKLDEAKQGAIIQVVDAAVPPQRRSFPKRGLIVIGATILGFLAGIGVAILSASFDKLRQRPEANEKLTAFRRAMFIRARS